MFASHLACSDASFIHSIEKTKDDWESEEINLTPAQLMQKALTKHETCLLNQIWNKPSHEEAEIIALQAKIDKLSKQKPGTTNPGTPAAPKVPRAPRKRTFTSENKFCSIKPKPGEPTTKTAKGKIWHWCSFHEFWCSHTLKDCEATKKAQKEASQSLKHTDNIAASLAHIRLEDVLKEEDDE